MRIEIMATPSSTRWIVVMVIVGLYTVGSGVTG